jgi:hypothetical protein
MKLLPVLALAAASAAFAQPVHTGGAMATRPVSRYLALEREVQQAVAAHDTGAVQSHVAGDFTYRSPASPDTIDRDAWLAREPRRTPAVRDLTVHEEGGLAVVSFVAGRRFIVDVWKDDQLVARFAAIAADAPRAPKRPSGRE